MNVGMALLSKIAPEIFGVIDRVLGDDAKAQELKMQLARDMAQADSAMARAGADVVMAEANSDGWLQRNWRPGLMVWFAFLIGAYWFGWTPPNLSDDRAGDLFDLVQIGVGGYVIGRSVEKTARTVAGAIKS